MRTSPYQHYLLTIWVPILAFAVVMLVIILTEVVHPVVIIFLFFAMHVATFYYAKRIVCPQCGKQVGATGLLKFSIYISDHCPHCDCDLNTIPSSD